MLYIIMQL